ncbi:DsbA family protein [Pannonibacter sp. SL95]|uniref:DsbA family protein n=1 Tax=Pannonibacter sp. SL95 TaxID=2995153 RepID=UPI002272E9EB|nr:DsbA family protein [Pannonibacter sp. SL95]MCY1708084.1 DsbA family protein [Pannonibacter sp. SL95]
MKLTRRTLLASTMALGLGTTLSAAFPLVALAETVDVAKLMEPSPLGEKSLGKEDAPVTIVEYASMTCGHCANFHKTTLPEIKKQYIDTGKVRMIFREFPLDPVSAAGFMLARCAPEEKYFDVMDALFADQRAWAFTNDPYNSMLNFSKQLGFTQESFEACLTNQSLLDGVNAVRDKGGNEFKVDSTPTFFINGEKVSGALSFEEMSKIIDKNL